MLRIDKIDAVIGWRVGRGVVAVVLLYAAYLRIQILRQDIIIFVVCK